MLISWPKMIGSNSLENFVFEFFKYSEYLKSSYYNVSSTSAVVCTVDFGLFSFNVGGGTVVWYPSDRQVIYHIWRMRLPLCSWRSSSTFCHNIWPCLASWIVCCGLVYGDIHLNMCALDVFAPHVSGCYKLLVVSSCIHVACLSWQKHWTILLFSSCCFLIDICTSQAFNGVLCVRQLTLMPLCTRLLGHLKFIGGRCQTIWSSIWHFAQLIVYKNGSIAIRSLHHVHHYSYVLLLVFLSAIS